ncbi:MAG: ABC transporter permease, partial [Chloroflexota bacterium]|nr:ABC transporter permease [Chloroflexota bacterium]
AAVSLPWFNLLTGKSLAVDPGTTLFALGAVVVIGGVVGCVSGSYPAFYLSGLAPIETLKGTLASGSGTTGMRRVLVVSQFVISIALIICTGVVYNQLDFIQQRNMGLNTDQVVAVPLTFDPVQETARIYKQRVKESPYVTNATSTYILPGHKNAVIPITLQRPGEGDYAKIDMNQAWTDEDFLETLGIEVVTGRYFDPSFVSDWGWETAGGGAVLNEAAVTRLGFDSPEDAVGKEVNWMRELRQGWDEEGVQLRRIVGVVKDFHFASLHQPIAPLVLFADFQGGHVVVKIKPEDMAEGLAAIEEIWHEVNPEFAFEYFFVEDNFARLYDAERRFGQVFVSFAVLAVLIACLGLFGLASFTAERRTKEIGVRKVLGASSPKLFRLLSNEFVRLVIVANVFAWPAAYLVMNNWLGNFAYRVDLGWTTFILAGVLAMAIALLTVSYQAVRAATANPIESLRTE